MTKNLYEKYATFIDLPDKDVFHHLIEAAKDQYQREQLTNVPLETIKSSHTPVIFASSVKNRTKEDNLLLRTEMNKRATRKYLIIDADFNRGEEEQSRALYQKLIQLGKELQTPLVIYPTISYPTKPRFRAALFTKRALSDSQYYQAMTWLYRKLGVSATDKADYQIKSNNNAPVFINDEQVALIVDTTQDDSLEVLDSHLWRGYDKPPKPRKKKVFDREIDKELISRFKLMTGTKKLLQSGLFNSYNTFWPFVYSLARAVIVEQITNDEALAALTVCASAAEDDTTRLYWESENRTLFEKTKAILEGDEVKLYDTRPLLTYTEFKNL